LVACGDPGDRDFKAILVGDDGSGSGRLALSEEPLYFVAACAETVPREVLKAALGPFAVLAGTVRYAAIKRRLHDVEQEFDERGAWARRLDKEVRARDETIRGLQGEIKDLRSQAAELSLTSSPEAKIKEQGARRGRGTADI